MDPRRFFSDLLYQSHLRVEQRGQEDVRHELLFERDWSQVTSADRRLYLTASLPRRRFFIALSGIFLIIGVLLTRALWMQVGQAQTYAVLAENNRLRSTPLWPLRGVISDRTGVILAENTPRFQVIFTPRQGPHTVNEQETILGEAGRTLGIPYATLLGYATATGIAQDEPVIVADKIPYPQAMRFATVLPRLQGFQLVTHPVRRYPQSTAVESLSHVLGYVGRLSPEEYAKNASHGYLRADEIGKTGLERSYEQALRGALGERKDEVDARGQVNAFVGEQAPRNGQDMTINLDVALQAEAERALKEEMVKAKTSRGAVVALDPRDGAVLALVSLPAFDNNSFAGSVSSTVYQRLVTDPAQPLFARATAGSYPSGSTVKIVMSLAALAEGVIMPTTQVLSNGGIYVGQWFFPDWKAGGHGMTNVRKAIAMSVNTFYYYIGGGYGNFSGLGVERINKWMRTFGLGTVTGIDLPAEAAGHVPDPAWKKKTRDTMWYIGDTYNLSIGQGDLLVSPLQVAVYTAEIANGGKRVTPHLISDVTTTTKAQRAASMTKIEAPTTAFEEVRMGMRDNVTYGSGRSLSTLPFTSGAKTGTAQWSSTGNTHAWFTSFAPYETPEIVVTVLLEEGGEGSTYAVPVAKNVLAKWNELKQVRGGKF